MPGYEEIDFRDVEAFSDREAVLLSAGSPLLIFHTMDGGQTWMAISNDSYHGARRAKCGTWVLLAGSDGRIASFN